MANASASPQRILCRYTCPEDGRFVAIQEPEQMPEIGENVELPLRCGSGHIHTVIFYISDLDASTPDEQFVMVEATIRPVEIQ